MRRHTSRKYGGRKKTHRSGASRHQRGGAGLTLSFTNPLVFTRGLAEYQEWDDDAHRFVMRSRPTGYQYSISGPDRTSVTFSSEQMRILRSLASSESESA